ncbi:MAG: 3-hydroxyacyl-CoA dehydrogenase [Tissierellia bacterium]|nr:3-hydroxyacyl-CoA dehydrogenase [Tissierellia bacterium]
MENKKVVILGGGVLGAQIALMNAYTNHDTTIWLRSQGSIGRTQPKLDRYKKLMIQSLKEARELLGNPMGAYLYPKGLIKNWEDMTEEKMDQLIAQAEKNLTDKLQLELDMEKALKDADIVIESMSEDPQAKKEVYHKAKDLLEEKTILCTNSSTLLPSMFAEDTGRPEKYMALHFANEIWKFNTAECMGHPGTDPEVYDRVVAYAEEINMVPIKLYKEQPGYVLNSLLVPFLDAAQKLWGAGIADPHTIDTTWVIGTGAPVGPFKIMDVVGLKTVHDILAMKPQAKDPQSLEYKILQMVKEKLDKGETGVNAGKGFYDYSE